VELISFADGTFYTPAVRSGTWRLTLAETDAERLNVDAPTVIVVVTPETPASGVRIVLTRR
ncbi:MAG TPA: hypothetical protein VNL98_03270, partial [Gemmatimonadales bacterium]|nr:hypothetical protein [Gemmatimonadales bacterium]